MNKFEQIEAVLLKTIPVTPGLEQDKHYKALEILLQLQNLPVVAWCYHVDNKAIVTPFEKIANKHQHYYPLYSLERFKE